MNRFSFREQIRFALMGLVGSIWAMQMGKGFLAGMMWGTFAFWGIVYGNDFKVEPLRDSVRELYGLDGNFFKKGTMVQDILIATSERVADHTHLETAYLFDHMMGELREDVAQRIRDQKVLCILVAHDELTSDVPQFKTEKAGKELDFYNWRQRGFLTKVDERYIVFFAEEDVMEYEGGMTRESILIHEFGHVVHGPGFDDGLRQKWTDSYEASMAKGLWNDGYAAQRFRRVQGDDEVLLLDALVKAFPEQKRELFEKCLDGGDILVNGAKTDSKVKVTGKDEVLIVFGGDKECYARKNRAEYFAEGFQIWYDTNRTMDHDHNHIHTRDQLKKYDEVLSGFLGEIVKDGDWRFISPRERAGQGHFADYDPAKAPVVKQLEHIRNASLDYYDEYWSGYWERLHKKHGMN